LCLIALPYVLLAMVGPFVASAYDVAITHWLKPQTQWLSAEELRGVASAELVRLPWYLASLAAVVLGWLATLAALVIVGIPGLVVYTVVGLLSGAERFMLVGKYLRKKKSPLFAAGAVTLCTAMVIIVISIMGGFLSMLRQSAHKLTGDVIVQGGGLSGFAYYDELIERFEADPAVEAATPVITSYGLIRFRFELDDGLEPYYQSKPVSLQGIDPAGMSKVVGLGEGDTLYWQREDAANVAVKDFKGATDFQSYGMQLQPPAEWGLEMRGIVPGIEVNEWNRRSEEDGSYRIEQTSPLGDVATLTVVPVTAKAGLLEPTSQNFAVVNEFKSGLYEIDDKRVYLPFETLQEMLLMHRVEIVDANTGLPTGEVAEPRTSQILIKAAEGVTAEQLAERITQIKQRFLPELRDRLLTELPDRYRQQVGESVRAELAAKHPELSGEPYDAAYRELMNVTLGKRVNDEAYGRLREINLLTVQTWEELYGQLLAAVENEKSLITMLFALISIVAIAMIAVVFYMIVMDKTWDIGVLRASGASALGIVNIFLGYGLLLGLLGATLGTVLAAVVVLEINAIQTFLGTQLGAALFCLIITVGMAAKGVFLGFVNGLLTGRSARSMCWLALLLGGAGLLGGIATVSAASELRGVLDQYNFQMWDAQTYYFDRIPSKLDALEVTVIYLGAVLSSVLGAVIPAIRAGTLVPVEALRYE